MTSGDNAGGAGAPAVVATPRPPADGPAPERATAPARPSAAELCQDSDDLLTSRRGRLVEPLAAASSQEADPAPAPADEAGIPFSAPPFDGGQAAATPFPPEAAVAAPEAASLDAPNAESADAERIEASVVLAEPIYDPFAALPIPEDVEQAAAASYFVAWLPDEPETAEAAPPLAPAADAAAPTESPAAADGERAAETIPTMGVPLLAALGLTDEAGGAHTNGHAAANGASLDPAAAPLLHEQETREVLTEPVADAAPAAESIAGTTPTAEPASPPAAAPEDTSALIASMLAPSAPAAATAVADAPLSVVALPSGSEASDAVIELPRADGLSSEAEPVAVAAPPAEPPMEPPAPPASSSPPPPPPASPLPEEGEEEGATMTIIEHLEELRKRITVSAISIVVCAVFSWFFVPHVVNLLETDVRSLGFHFVNLSPLGPLGLNIKLAFVGGLIIASPIVFYEIWAFVAPGLTRKERRYALPFSLIGGALFALGAATAIVIIPLALRFLVSFFPVFDLEQLLDINQYIMFITLIAVIFGITFELPIFMVGFSLLGVVNSRFFIQKFKIALFIMYGVAMVITPGADFVSPLVLGTFLVALYWLGVLLIRFIGK